MQIPYAKIGLRAEPRIALFSCLVAWLAAAMLVAVLPEDSGFRSGTAVLAVSATAVFAIGASGYAAPAVQVKERLFWVLMSSGLLLRFAGYLSWLGLGESPTAMQYAPVTKALYILSYLMLFAAMLYLIGIATRRIAWISAMDAVAVILSFGTLVWFFALGDAVQPSGVADSIAAAARPALDAGLLYASLVIVSAPRRPRWANFLAPGFLTLLIACLFYLGGPGGTRSVGGWTELLGALGLALLGAGALYAASHKSGFETHQTIPLAHLHVLARAALSGGAPRDTHGVGYIQSAAAGLCAGRQRGAHGLLRPAHLAALLHTQTVGSGTGSGDTPYGAGSHPPGATRDRETGSSRHLPDPRLRLGGRETRRGHGGAR